MTGGVGGTGLGLYIARELVRGWAGASGSSPTRRRARCSHVEIHGGPGTDVNPMVKGGRTQ
jgi:hypothetical protein